MNRVIRNNTIRKTWVWLLVTIMVVTLAIPTGIKAIAGDSSVTITESAGCLESAYVEWAPVTNATAYHVYYKSASAADTTYTMLDDMLIRQYDSYFRADATGLKAGDYVMKVVPVFGESENADKAKVSSTLTVLANTREGFAFSAQSTAKTGSGGYNNDGTAASNAQIVYVSEVNKNTVTASVITSSKGTTTTCTGIGAILSARSKGYDSRPLIIRVIGKVTMFANSANSLYMQLKGTQNLTLEGIGEDATLYGMGVLLRDCTNVEVRNIGVMMFPDDGISLDTDNNNIWIHNNDIFYGAPGSDADQVKGDGSCDIKAFSNYITVSYNHFWDSGKCSLCGMSDTKEFFVTYHHNWFDHSDSRQPRVRVGTIHVYNNYFDGNAKYGVGVTKGSSVFVENNYFRNCKYPMLSSLQGSDIYGTAEGTFSGEAGGMIKAYGNTIIGATRFVDQTYSATDFDAITTSSRNATVSDTYKTVSGGTTYNNFDTASTMYTYSVDTPDNAKVKVETYAGRINGGDFKWSFNDQVDDEAYAVNTALKSAIVGYTSKLVSIGGKVVNGENQTSQDTTAAGTTAAGTTAAATQSQSTAAGVQVHNFTKDGLTSSFFTFNSDCNLATGKGTVTYNGLTLTQCLKMESKTQVTFTATQKGKLTLVFLSATANVKVNGTKLTSTDGTITVDVPAGSNSITKADSNNLYYMIFTPEGSETPTQATTTAPTQATTTAPTEPTTNPSIPDTSTSTGLVTSISSVKDSALKTVVYCSPDASATGSGTSNSPMTLEKALELSKTTDGIAILLKDGTYSYNYQITIPVGNNGSSNAYKVLKAAEGAKVILDFSSQPYGDTATNARGLQLEGNYWYVYGITVMGAADNGIFVAGSNNVIERCILKGNRDSGLQISRRNSSLSNMADWPSNNYIINCTSFNNMDPATHENADGFASKLTCGNGNVFDGCISYCNIDDGWDLYAKTETGSIGVVTIKNCISFNNGTLTDGTTSTAGDRNGFKLGGSNGKVPTPHIVLNCLSFKNGKDGFTDNGNGGALSISYCTSYDNAGTNFNFYRTNDGKFSNLLTVSGNDTDKFIGTIQDAVYYNGGKYYLVQASAQVTSGLKIGTVILAPTASDFTSMTVPDVTKDIDTLLRNSDGTVTTNGYLMTNSDSRFSKLGAKFGGSTNTLNLNVVTKSGQDQEPTTQPATQPATQPVTEPTTGNNGTYSPAEVVNANSVVASDKVAEEIIHSTGTAVTVVTNNAPQLDSTVFNSIMGKDKEVSVKVVNADNQLLYSWSFDGNKISNANIPLDLTISFDTDKQQAIETLTGQTNALYISFSQHGELPGPATIKTYVGDKYKNGEALYLYYYNEESKKIELISDKGLTVNDGYVEYTITHCSVYFLSQNAQLSQESVTTAQISEGTTVAQNSDSTATAVKTSDNRGIVIYIVAILLAGSVFSLAYVSKKRRV